MELVLKRGKNVVLGFSLIKRTLSGNGTLKEIFLSLLTFFGTFNYVYDNALSFDLFCAGKPRLVSAIVGDDFLANREAVKYRLQSSLKKKKNDKIFSAMCALYLQSRIRSSAKTSK